MNLYGKYPQKGANSGVQVRSRYSDKKCPRSCSRVVKSLRINAKINKTTFKIKSY